MNYPVWDLPFLSGGLVVAKVAIFHVLISHIAIGGGAFLFGAELWIKGQSEANKLRAWLRKFTLYFLITSTVLGAVTGVGIWFAIQLAGPEATSLLIHQFVFVWAVEWVFFLVELTSLYLYYYGFGKNSHKTQTLLAGIYFIVAWLSLFAINGIITFMLTPGRWTLAEQDLTAAFFNPTFWPSLFLRTAMMLMLGGLFGLLMAARARPPLKERIVIFAAKWVLPAALLLPVLGYWYWLNLPQSAIELTAAGAAGISGGRLEIMNRHLVLFCACLALIFIGTALAAIRPRNLSTLSAVALLVIAQIAIAGGEFYREMARKPYVIYGTLFSNSLWKEQAEDAKFLKGSFLAKARWIPSPQPLSREHGEWIFRLQCAACHTRDGYRSLQKRTAAWTPEFGLRWLGEMERQGVMPPFSGDDRDKAALVAYILSLQGREEDAAQLLEMTGKTRP